MPTQSTSSQDGNDVSTQHIEYVAHKEQLELTNNVYNGVDAVKQYLFKFPQELDATYNTRASRATLRNFVKRAVSAFTGMIFRKNPEISGYGTRTERSFDKIDTKNNILNFTKIVTNAVTKDSKAYILIDSPPIVNANTPPYMTLIERAQLINWRRDANGHFTMAVIQSLISEPDGKFGTEYLYEWRHYTADGKIEVYREQTPEKGQNQSSSNATNKSADRYYLVETIQSQYMDIPLVEITVGDVPILYDIAQMNIKHYNRQSHKDRYLTMAALPIPVIWGADVDDNGNAKSATPALIIGVDEAFIFTGTKDEADFQWRELSGTSIALLEADLNAIVEDITTGILRASETANSVQKTATEVQLLQAEASNRTSTLATAVEVGMKEALVILHEFNKEVVPADAVFILNKDFNSSLMGSDGARVVTENYLMGMLSTETFLKTLSDMELITIDSAEKEIARIVADKFKPVSKVESIDGQDKRTKSAISSGEDK